MRLALVLCLLATPLVAQDYAAQNYVKAPGGVLRWLDKISGEVADIELSRGQAAISGRLTIQLDECRYPKSNPASDAYAHLTIMEQGRDMPVFSGWMMASSPALSALEHPRYDVWMLRCITPDQPHYNTEPPPAEEDMTVPQEG